MTQRDPEAALRYEGIQQRLVEGIITSLHNELEDHIPVFTELAVEILSRLREEPSCLLSGKDPLFNEVVLLPIRNFTAQKQHPEIERKLLLSMVLEKLLGSIRAKIIGDYNRVTM